MSGCGLGVLTVFILCVCQLVADLSTHAHLARGNSFNPRQENLTNNTDDQHYRDGPSADNARFLDGLPDVFSVSGKPGQYRLDRQQQLVEDADNPGTGGMPAITSRRNRNGDTQGVGVSEANVHHQVSTTTPAADPTSHRQLPHQFVSSFGTSLNMEHFVASGTRQQSPELDNFRNLSISVKQTVVQNMSPENLAGSSKPPHSSVLEVSLGSGHKVVSRTDVRFVNKMDALADSLKDDNSTLLQPESASSSQLSHTNISTSSHNMVYIKNAKSLTEARRSIYSDTVTHHSPATATRTRQSNNTATTHHLRPVTVSGSKSNNADIPHHQRPVTVSWRKQSNTATVHHLRPVSRHHEKHVSPETQSSVFLAGVRKDDVSTTTEAQIDDEPGTRALVSEAQTEDKGQLQHEDVHEEVANETSICASCSKSLLTEEQVKAIRLEMFKDLLAEKMRINLHDQMNMDGALNDHKPRARLPKLPMDIVEQTIKANVEENERDQFYARDQEIIIAGEDLGRDCPRSEITGCYRFPVRDKLKLPVAEARLWFYKLKDVNDVNGQIFRVIHFNNSRYQNGRLIAASESVTIQEGWIQMNVTGEVHKWLGNGREAPLLAIRCPTCKAKSYTSLFGVRQGYKPLLVLKYFTNGHATRDKRSRACDPVSECCKRDLEVNFSDISMVEIIEPRSLSIGYCYGSCNEAHHFAYNHTALVQRLRLSSSYSSQPTMSEQLRPCCVPLVLKDTFLMAIEGGVFVTKIVPKVIVESCGCV